MKKDFLFILKRRRLFYNKLISGFRDKFWHGELTRSCFRMGFLTSQYVVSYSCRMDRAKAACQAKGLCFRASIEGRSLRKLHSVLFFECGKSKMYTTCLPVWWSQVIWMLGCFHSYSVAVLTRFSLKQLHDTVRVNGYRAWGEITYSLA